MEFFKNPDKFDPDGILLEKMAADRLPNAYIPSSAWGRHPASECFDGREDHVDLKWRRWKQR